MSGEEYDLVVIGGGMAGLPMSIKSAYKGQKTALVEEDLLGGTCLNRGCIPTKTMIRSAEVAHLAGRAAEFGIEIDGEVSTDMEAVVERKNRVVDGIRDGSYRNVENTDSLDLVEGRAVFESPTEIAVDDRTLTAETVVVNTGARPAEPVIDGLGDVPTLDSTSALALDAVPERLAVVGAGYVGAEYAQMFRRFGADVTLFQRNERILPEEEPEASAVVQDAFESEGIDVYTDAPVEELWPGDETRIGVEADRDGESVTAAASHVLIATGRRPNADGIGLDEIGVERDERGSVEIDDRFQTTVEGIYAMGDVTGPPMFTHSARNEADLLYRHLVKGEDISGLTQPVPHAIFTDPEVGRVGLTEAEAREQGHEVLIGRSEYDEQGKPKALGETEGFVKIVSDADTREVLGCHVVGEGATAIVHEVIVAMRLGGTARDIADTIHIHPTLPEVVNSAAGGVHKPS